MMIRFVTVHFHTDKLLNLSPDLIYLLNMMYSDDEENCGTLFNIHKN